MPTESLRAQVQAHWRAFDALADSQSGGNEAIIRALDIFAGDQNMLYQLAVTQEPVQQASRTMVHYETTDISSDLLRGQFYLQLVVLDTTEPISVHRQQPFVEYDGRAPPRG